MPARLLLVGLKAKVLVAAATAGTSQCVACALLAALLALLRQFMAILDSAQHVLQGKPCNQVLGACRIPGQQCLQAGVMVLTLQEGWHGSSCKRF
jgi:hypothetical protein